MQVDAISTFFVMTNVLRFNVSCNGIVADCYCMLHILLLLEYYLLHVIYIRVSVSMMSVILCVAESPLTIRCQFSTLVPGLP